MMPKMVLCYTHQAIEPKKKGDKMDISLIWLGRIAGIAGAALSAFAGVMRLTGNYWFGGFQVGTLLAGGAVAMIFGCLCFAAYLVQNTRR